MQAHPLLKGLARFRMSFIVLSILKRVRSVSISPSIAMDKAFQRRGLLGPGEGPFLFFLGLGFPYNSLKTKKGALFYS